MKFLPKYNCNISYGLIKNRFENRLFKTKKYIDRCEGKMNFGDLLRRQWNLNHYCDLNFSQFNKKLSICVAFMQIIKLIFKKVNKILCKNFCHRCILSLQFIIVRLFNRKMKKLNEKLILQNRN